MHLTRGELWILGWLAREGFRSDVYSSNTSRSPSAAAVTCCITPK